MIELDALGDDFAEEEQGIPSYLREDASTELPDFVDEPPVSEQVSTLALLHSMLLICSSSFSILQAPKERLGEGVV